MLNTHGKTTQSLNLQAKLNDAECKSEFRVEKRDIPFPADVLVILDTIKCEGEEAFCILLKIFAYPVGIRT